MPGMVSARPGEGNAVFKEKEKKNSFLNLFLTNLNFSKLPIFDWVN